MIVIRGYRAASPLGVPALVARIRGQPFTLLRADRVYGEDHLRLAAQYAQRAVDEGRARAQDVATETLLYAAGERQIGKAIQFLGLQNDSTTIAAVAWDERALDALATEQGWTRDDAALEGGPDVLDAFDVSEVERAMLPRERWGEFVLERVAITDVLKA